MQQVLPSVHPVSTNEGWTWLNIPHLGHHFGAKMPFGSTFNQLLPLCLAMKAETIHGSSKGGWCYLLLWLLNGNWMTSNSILKHDLDMSSRSSKTIKLFFLERLGWCTLYGRGFKGKRKLKITRDTAYYKAEPTSTWTQHWNWFSKKPSTLEIPWCCSVGSSVYLPLMCIGAMDASVDKRQCPQTTRANTTICLLWGVNQETKHTKHIIISIYIYVCIMI